MYCANCGSPSSIPLFPVILQALDHINLFHLTAQQPQRSKVTAGRQKQEQGFIPLYKRQKITDDLHEACGFRTDYQFITKSQMKTIQKKVKAGNKIG